MTILDNSRYFYDNLIEIYCSDSKPREKIIGIYASFKELLKKITGNEKQSFSSYFARLVFIIDKHGIPQDITSDLKNFRHHSLRLIREQGLICSGKDVRLSVKCIAGFIHYISDEEIPGELNDIISKVGKQKIPAASDKEAGQPGTEGSIPFLRAVVLKKSKERLGNLSFLYCESEDYGTVTLRLNIYFTDIWKITWAGAALNCFNLIRLPDTNIEFGCTPETLIVLEPDILFDATELAECFQNKGAVPELYFLKKYKSGTTKLPLVLGNIVNTCFDELLTGEGGSFRETFAKALKYKPLQILSLLKKSPGDFMFLEQKAEYFYKRLLEIIPFLAGDIACIEPTFISAQFGIQGRLDLMIEYENDLLRKDIVELKSGSAPNSGLSYTDDKNRTFITGLWQNHIAQTSCYNLLLESTYKDRRGSTMILYAAAESNPLRNAPNITRGKREVLNLRNWLLALEKSIGSGKYSLFSHISKENIGKMPDFIQSEIDDFHETYFYASDLEREYFNLYSTFIFRELAAMKTGMRDSGGSSGFSSLWKDSFHEKAASMNIIAGLKLDAGESDFANFHLSFTLNKKLIHVSSIRKGDLCILYPIEKDGSAKPLERQILKCSVKSLDSEKITLSLRNKSLSTAVFEHYDEWILEPDYIESTSRNLYRSLYQFLKASKEKKEIILGVRPPEFENLREFEPGELTEEQNRLLSQALAAKDYFLIQGPPGTGKTSYFLKRLAEILFNESSENVLILAYTNRAADEICSAFKKTGGGFNFFRLGSKDASEHTDKLLFNLIDELSMEQVLEEAIRCRFYVSTVSFVLANPEIFEIKSFDTAVIDEASQILEPHLAGILSSVRRFIMIGDEKQLPAIVRQTDLYLPENSLLRKEILLESLGESLFERLLRCCRAFSRTDAFGMLSRQARMHRDIQELVNELFYGGQLKPLQPCGWQTSVDSDFPHYNQEQPESIIFSSRLVFIESPAEQHSKINHTEATRAARIADFISKMSGTGFREKSLGIISPFRLQCAEILSELDAGIKKLITVDTVERFQGSERDTIIISFAANKIYNLSGMQSLTIIDDYVIDRKLNVAITRARERLIILGNSWVLSHSPVYGEMLEYIKRNGSYFSECEF